MTFSARPVPSEPIDFLELLDNWDDPQSDVYKDAVALISHRTGWTRTFTREWLDMAFVTSFSRIMSHLLGPQIEQAIADDQERARSRAIALRLNNNMRAAVGQSLRGLKDRSRTFALVGYTVEELKAHLEAQFVEGMSWDNYGPIWHVDHIKPLAVHRITGPDCPEFKAAWALSNLRPLWAIDNIRKGAKWEDDRDEH